MNTGTLGPRSVACFIGSGILFILCVLGWDDRSREEKPLGTIDVGRDDELKLAVVCAVSVLVFITLLVRILPKQSAPPPRGIGRFGHIIRSPFL